MSDSAPTRGAEAAPVEPFDPSRESAASRWVTRGFALLFALSTAWALRGLVPFVLATEYRADDWSWLLHGRGPGPFLAHATSFGELYRPAFHAVYLFQYPLFGTNALPLAVGLGIVWVATAWVFARAFRAAGFDPLVAAAAAILPLHLPPLTDAFYQISFQGLTLSRLFLGLTCLAFLSGRSWRWYLPLLLVGIAIHEQFIAVGPVVAFLVLWRDGWRGLWRSLGRGGRLRRFLTLYGVVAATRVAFYVLLPRESHALTGSRLAENLDGLVEIARARADDGDLVLWVTALGVALTGLPWQRLPRLLIVSIGAAAACLAPFLLAPYWTRYFGNTIVCLLALIPAWVLLATARTDLLEGGLLRRGRAVALMGFLVAWGFQVKPEIQPRHAEDFPLALAAALDPVIEARLDEIGEIDAEVDLLFVESPTFVADERWLMSSLECQGAEYCSYFVLLWPRIEHAVGRVSPEALASASGAACDAVYIDVAVSGTRAANPWAPPDEGGRPMELHRYAVRTVRPPACPGSSAPAP